MSKDWAALTEQVRGAVGVLKILSHEIRLLTVCHLSSGEKSVQELEAFLGTSQSNVSQHLAKMRIHGLIDYRKEGNLVYYRLADEKILKLMLLIQEMYCGDVSRGKQKRP